MNDWIGVSGLWYSFEAIEAMDLRWTDAEQCECKVDPRRQMVWIPNDIARLKGIYGRGEWMPPVDRPLKRPNDRGVLRFLADVCREQVPA